MTTLIIGGPPAPQVQEVLPLWIAREANEKPDGPYTPARPFFVCQRVLFGSLEQRVYRERFVCETDEGKPVQFAQSLINRQVRSNDLLT
jgi:hypothetical protein